MNKNILLATLSGAFLAIVLFTVAFSLLDPRFINPNYPEYNSPPTIDGTAAKFKITAPVSTSFSQYIPYDLSYKPSVPYTQIKSDLSNVDLQGLSISQTTKTQLATYGFSLVDEEIDDIYKLYISQEETPKFITTDLCLHAYHVLYDISLRVLEGTYLSPDFEIMLNALRDDQISQRSSATDLTVLDALDRNIAYLSVMLFLLDNTSYPVPSSVASLVNAELQNIEAGNFATSAIFGYNEDYSQYKVRGHYTRNDLLAKYFKAMMYAGRMGFLLQSPTGEIEMGIEHTRMSMLLISSFNVSIGLDNVWDYWDRIYEPTVFYVGASDDLTPAEYYQVWKQYGSLMGDELSDELMILNIISTLKASRNPQINSMLINEMFEISNVTQGFRLMGQRFIPDSYIFQNLVHTAVPGRFMPNGLDILSVFGSSRAEKHLETENSTYSDYNDQILKLRAEFGNLTAYDWTQNLYWLWLYTLFPLLEPATEGYPSFMLSDAWTDKALMTTLGSWAELRHDTILYAKQSYTQFTSIPELLKGYVEPYPEVYARLSSLVQMMNNGLDTRGLLVDAFKNKLTQIEAIFDHLVEISIKELENQPLSESDYFFINRAGEDIGMLASYSDPETSNYTSEADDRMAIIADVHTDPNLGEVLEVGTGNAFSIYVVVSDSNSHLRLTRGGTFSYYEFKNPLTNRLTDEEWHIMLDTNPPALPAWIVYNLPLSSDSDIIATVIKEE
ncbi:DUF3160 domain-containing protein [Candidatus Hodarchaeum mangrovi]